MKEFNVTGQVYKTNDPNKQTILFNTIVYAQSADCAENKFTYYLPPHYTLVKIYSVEEISQEAA